MECVSNGGPLEMICHVVFYRMKPGTSESDEAALMGAARRTLATLPGVRNLKVGKSLSGPAKGFTIALVMDFENEAELDAYRVEARHKEFVKGVAEPLIEDIWRFDFEWN